MNKQKRVAAIHDISGFGKCSLTVALPIISAAGIETSVIPTAVLSTHTGGMPGFTYRDLTQDIRRFYKHWKSLELKFDGLYSGFLGSFEQIDIISDFFDEFRQEDNIILVDPVMADDGQLYSIFKPDFIDGMRKLCSKADIIVPNLTEACFMTGQEYKSGPYTRHYIEKLLQGLGKLGAENVVLTGVCFDDNELGAACYDSNSGDISYAFSKRIGGHYHGTGDIFASALISALLNGFNLTKSAQIAADFTAESINRTAIAKTDPRFGVNFEAGLPGLIKSLGLK